MTIKYLKNFAWRKLKQRNKMRHHISKIYLVTGFTFLLINVVNGLANCPPGCECDDNTLVVQCGEGRLDVLPIALNPSIQRLVIRNNKIKTIDSSIQFYTELTFLDLSANHLMTIPPRTFAYQKKLQELHLNYNKIGQISNNTFIGLSTVVVVNLRGNLISELHKGTFLSMNKIEELNLGANRINFIDSNAFDGLTELRILYLDDNDLTSVPDSVILQTIPSLAELFLGMNSLLTIPSFAFRDVKGLTHLDLNGAGLTNISYNSFDGLEALRVLVLTDNHLSRIPTLALSHLMRLEELALGQNDFDVITEGAFVGLKQLKRLDITGALRLKRIMNGAFDTNTNLEYLNLSSNKMLVEVQEGALSGLLHLQHVILKANALTTLDEGLFTWRDLTSLDVSQNPIACDCRVMWLRNLLISRNNTEESDTIPDVVCEYPERLIGESLKNLNPTLMGCSHTDPRKQALIGALLVGSAATITALALIVYRCRRRIREYMKGGVWGSSALGRKEREYQKTFCDEDYITHHQHHPCSLGIHSTFTNSYTHHPMVQHYGMCPISINEVNADNAKKNFQQLQVPTASILSDKKAAVQPCGSIGDSAPFMVHMKMATSVSSQKLNHYTKPQYLTATTAVGDSFYSYADMPIARHTISNSNINFECEQNNQHLRLTQDHFNQPLHCASDTQDYKLDTGRNNADPNYIYHNAHYSMPVEQTGYSETSMLPSSPPALPLRNGLHAATTGRRFVSSSGQKLDNSITMRKLH